jgi:geranylgeranyl pyrophosphate synthase
LQTLAFKAIAEDETLSADIRVRLISVIAAASGTPGGMVSGQQLDLNAETKKLSLQEIDSIHHQKTGALTSAAAIAGAVIGCATDEETSAIKQYAAKIGLLFQITDDLLDVTQPTEILGKTAGKDAAAQKPTYPAHYGIEQTAIIAKNIRNDAYEALVPLQKDTTLLRSIAELIHDRIN